MLEMAIQLRLPLFGRCLLNINIAFYSFTQPHAPYGHTSAADSLRISRMTNSPNQDIQNKMYLSFPMSYFLKWGMLHLYAIYQPRVELNEQ